MGYHHQEQQQLQAEKVFKWRFSSKPFCSEEKKQAGSPKVQNVDHFNNL